MIQLFREPKFNFLRWKWHWAAVSLLLLVAGIVTMASKGGLRLGIDFKGGTLVYLKFAQTPDLDRIRNGLADQGLGASTIQSYGPPANNEVIIGAEQTGHEDEAVDTSRQAILDALRTTFQAPADKFDLNNAGTDTLSSWLIGRDPIGLGANPTEAAARYRLMAEQITGQRDNQQGGLITSFEQLRALPEVPPVVVTTLEQQAFLSPYVVRNVEVVGPKVGEQLRRQALLATGLALGGILVYIGVRFRQWVYGSAAVVAVFHDLLLTVAFLSLFDYQFDLNVVAALLTLVGFSVNDTIVTFDRIRENARLLRRERFATLVNTSINQTLSRTILTSGLTFLSVLALFFLGGEVLHGFAFTLVVGVIIGTYSSVFIASPIVVGWIEHGQARVSAVGGASRKGR